MAKRGATGQEKPREATVRKGIRWRLFLDDWGRLVIPVGVVAILFALHWLGVLDDRGVGFVVGCIVLLGSVVAAGIILWQNEFPRWVRTTAIAGGVLFLAGVGLPFMRAVYPGTPAFDRTVSKETVDAKTASLGGGLYTVEVRAAETENAGGKQARFAVTIGDEKVSGAFSDIFQTMRGRKNTSRQVEVRHLSEQRLVGLPGGEMPVKLALLDPAFGTEVRVRLFPVLLPPGVMYATAILLLLFATFVDGRFQDQTDKWRLTPWIGVVLTFLIFFNWDFNADDVTRHAIGATIVGGIVGFLVGWVVSLIGRVVVGKIRTRA
ncbi:MAG: hypothetical protein FJ087_11080 [Deltaproteobacteria bacterium]|nr:hypothetical protein [Deltaproteobacteria bacterium]